MKQGNFWNSFGYAFRGVWFVLRSQRNARVHVAAVIAVVGAGLWCGVSRAEWCLLALACAGVWAAEVFNTALEVLADAVTLEQNPLIGRAKDAAAGAVLIMAIAAVVVGAVIFVPYIF